jgi:hypothetical protein
MSDYISMSEELGGTGSSPEWLTSSRVLFRRRKDMSD